MSATQLNSPALPELRELVSATTANPDRPRPSVAFSLFLLLTAIIFLRPAEVVPGLAGWPIYETVMCVCVMAAFPTLLIRFRWNELASRPWVLCVVAMLPAILISGFFRGGPYLARLAGVDFAKTLVYYLLLLGLVNSPRRLQTFLVALALFVAVLAGLAVLNWHAIINLPALDAMQDYGGEDAITGEVIRIPRLVATGIFHDPNDFSLVIGAAVLIAAHGAIERGKLLRRTGWVLTAAILVYASTLTSSRGGFLALMAGVCVLLVNLVGWKRAFWAGILLGPIVLIVFSDRQLSIHLTEGGDTSQGRIHLWRDSLVLFKTSPLYGIGPGQLQEENELVAHNSYVHSFAELGVVGGTAFVGVWYLLFRAFWAARGIPASARRSCGTAAARVWRWKPYVLALTAEYAVGLFSLSRCYALSTYLLVGAVAAYLGVLSDQTGVVLPRLSWRLLRSVLLASVGTLVFLYCFVRVMVV